MTFGLKPLCLSLLVVLSAMPSLADWPGEWGILQLGEALGEAPEGRIPFTETRTVSYLETPITLSGYVLRQGDRIEKHVLAPFQESIVIDGNTVDVDTAEGEHHRFDVNDHALIRGLAAAMKATLRGDLEALQRQFQVTLTGGPDDWTLQLVPSDADLRETLPGITLTGRDAHVETIEIEGENGDRSTMTLQRDAS